MSGRRHVLAWAGLALGAVGCDFKAPWGDDTGGEGMCLDDFLAELAMDRDLLEAEAASRGIDASDLIEELVTGGLVVADFLFDCSAREGVEGLGEGTGGTFYEAESSDDMVDTLISVTQEDSEKSQDIIFLIDATGSMYNDIEAVRTRLEEVVEALDVDEDRASFAWFRDRHVDDPWYDSNSSGLMSPNAGELSRFLSDVEATGGGDLPESLYDAAYKTVDGADWSAEKRIVIAITDAGPNDNDTHNAEDVVSLCEDKGVVVIPILVGF